MLLTQFLLSLNLCVSAAEKKGSLVDALIWADDTSVKQEDERGQREDRERTERGQREERGESKREERVREEERKRGRKEERKEGFIKGKNVAWDFPENHPRGKPNSKIPNPQIQVKIDANNLITGIKEFIQNRRWGSATHIEGIGEKLMQKIKVLFGFYMVNIENLKDQIGCDFAIIYKELVEKQDMTMRPHICDAFCNFLQDSTLTLETSQNIAQQFLLEFKNDTYTKNYLEGEIKNCLEAKEAIAPSSAIMQSESA